MKENACRHDLENMVNSQIFNRGIKSDNVINAFLNVERHLFVKNLDKPYAYQDYPLSIGYDQTISQPYIVALSVDQANINKTDRVLEIGTGSGYQTAIIAELAKDVYTIERIEPLQKKAKSILESLNYQNIHYMIGNGYLGWGEYAPFDVIIISAAAPYVPEHLQQQLAIGGRMILPLGDIYWQRLILFTKEKDELKEKILCTCRFVPLVDKD